jgi:hypothetical protein
MPDGHGPAMPQVTAVDDQFGTHTAKQRIEHRREYLRQSLLNQPRTTRALHRSVAHVTAL